VTHKTAHPCVEPRFDKIFCVIGADHYISVKNRPILMKFGTIQQILNTTTVTWPKIEFFYLENLLFGHYSSNDCLIWVEFCTRKQNGMLTKACKFLNSKMAYGRHLEKRFRR